jgi:hypothetical protein
VRWSLATGPARAGVIININQVGTDVVVTGRGTLDTTDLRMVALDHDAVTHINPNLGFIILGPAGSVGIDEYKDATGPAPSAREDKPTHLPVPATHSA